MTFEEFLEEKNLTPESTPGYEHALVQEAYEAGYETGKLIERTTQCGKNNLLKDFERLEKKYDELLKKHGALVAKNNSREKVVERLIKENMALVFENAKLKENAVVWHKVTCFDEPDNAFITASNPAEEGKEYLVLLKNKHIVIEELYYDDNGYFFDSSWEEIEAWAELPEGKKC